MQRKIRLIDADDMITELIHLDDAAPWSDAQRGMILTLIGMVNAAPRKEYDPPREGAWRLIRGLAGSAGSTCCCVCTACGAPSAEMSHYCPSCGAEMRDPLADAEVGA